MDTKLAAALDALAQYRDEGVVLQAAIEDLEGQPAALGSLLSSMDTSTPAGLAQGFGELRERFTHTRQLLDVAIDFLDKAIEEVGGTPPYFERREHARLVAEEE
jgi:hypothetical protein